MTNDPGRNRLSGRNIGGLVANRFRLLIASALGLFAACANAGYAQLAPPPGWSPGQYVPAANDSSYGRVIHTPNGPTATVGGQTVKMPAAYRLAANAPRVAAAAIFLNPYVRTGVAIATWLGLAGIVWDAVNKKWTKQNNDYPVSDGFLYKGQYWAQAGYTSAEAACSAAAANRGAAVGSGFSNFTGVLVSPTDCRIDATSSSGVRITNWGGDAISKGASSCPSGWYVTPAGCVQSPPPKDVNQKDFEDALSPKPMPERVPQELPQPTPLPIEYPSPYINPDPGPNPEHKPRFVPSGDPVPNPNYDPDSAPGPNNQPYIQPGTKIQPSPTASQPWRVDYQPVNRPQPTKDPVNNPDGEDKPGDKEKEPDLCEKNPDIIACQKLEMPEDPGKLPVKEVEFEMTPESGFAGAAACPAPVQATLNGKTYGFSWQPFCNSLDMIKPLLLAFAWLSAAFILLGARGN